MKYTMIRSTEELSKTIKEAVDRRMVRASLLLIPLAIAIDGVLDMTNLTSDRIVSVILAIILASLITFGFLDLNRINKRPLWHINVCQIIGYLAFITIADTSTSYLIIFFMITILANVYYGRKGVILNATSVAVASIIKFVYLTVFEHIGSSAQIDIIVSVLLFMAVSGFFMSVQAIYDSERARLRDTIKESIVEQKRLRALINNMTESVLVLDKEGIVRLYNAAALALFNTNNSLSDKPLDGFILLEDDKGKIITAADLLPHDSKPLIRSDVLLRYSKDDLAALSIVSTPIRTTFGQEREEEGFVMTMRDITREKSLEEERDEFISVISHELRTPVTVSEAGISNAILQAQKLQNNEKILKSLQTAHDQSVFLANMLNDLTTFARAEKGTLEMKLEVFDPRNLIDNLMNDYRTAVEGKGMKIVTQVDPSTPLTMASNRLYIREILQNFITNAVKYSDKGTITLMTRAKDKGILYSVADEGIGISTADQKKIFEKFFRTEDYRTRSTNGTGLGLYIVKKLAKILDASFEVQSEVGKGSMFSLYVPDMSSILSAQQASTPTPVATAKLTNAPPAAPLQLIQAAVPSMPIQTSIMPPTPVPTPVPLAHTEPVTATTPTNT